MKQITIQASRDDFLTFILLVSDDQFNEILSKGMNDLSVKRSNFKRSVTSRGECLSLYVTVKSEFANYVGHSEIHYTKDDLSESLLKRFLRYRKSGCRIVSAGNF